ncbi:UNVERIFIED_CONTAM: hypothetical protein FKN15_035713 [Acipenser sinensis]
MQRRSSACQAISTGPDIGEDNGRSTEESQGWGGERRSGQGVRGQRESRQEDGGSRVYRELGEGVDSGEVRESSRGEDRGGEGTEVSTEGVDRGGRWSKK